MSQRFTKSSGQQPHHPYSDTARFLAELFDWDEVQPLDAPASHLLYVGSDDIDADLRKARRLGATVVTPKTEITGSGWFAIIQDPYGSRIALWS